MLDKQPIRLTLAGVTGWLHPSGRFLPIMAGAEDPPGTPPSDPPPADPPPGDPPTDRTFTQADLDRIVKDRLAKERGKYVDYDDLKSKAAKLDEIEQANASELEKANKRAEEAEAKVTAATERARKANLIAELAAHDDIGPQRAKAAAKLIEGVEYGDDGQPSNLGDQVKALVAEHPFLKAQPVTAGDGDGGKGSSGMTSAEARALAKSNPAEFNRKFEAGEIPASALGN